MRAFRKILAMLLLSVIGTCAAYAEGAQGTIAEKLKLLPADYQAIMTGELMEYDTPGDTIGLPNKFEGESTIEQLTDNYIFIKVTDSSSIQLKRLTDSKGKDIYVAVYTVCGPAADSRVNFFDADMQPLEAKKFIKMPQVKSFFSLPKGSLTKMSEIEKMLPFVTMEATLSPDNDDLVFTLTCQDYVSVDDYNILKLFLHPAKYTWQKGKYGLVNN